MKDETETTLGVCPTCGHATSNESDCNACEDDKEIARLLERQTGFKVRLVRD